MNSLQVRETGRFEVIKFLIGCVLILLFSTVSFGATPAFVQQIAATDASGVTTGSLPFEPMAGNSYIALVSHDSSIEIDNVIGDDGTTYLTKAVSAQNGDVTVELWYAHNVNGESAYFQVYGIGAGTINVNFSEWANLANAAPEDTRWNTDTSSEVDAGDVSASSGKSVIFMVAAWNSDVYLSGPHNGFTRMYGIDGGDVIQQSGYFIQTATDSHPTSWSIAENPWAACAAVFGES